MVSKLKQGQSGLAIVLKQNVTNLSDKLHDAQNGRLEAAVAKDHP